MNGSEARSGVSVPLAPEGAEALPLPVHLAGRVVSYSNDDVLFIKYPGNEPGHHMGVVDERWHLFNPVQKRAIIMASIMVPGSDGFGYTVVSEAPPVLFWGDGDIAVTLTDEQVAALNAQQDPPHGGEPEQQHELNS